MTHEAWRVAQPQGAEGAGSIPEVSLETAAVAGRNVNGFVELQDAERKQALERLAERTSGPPRRSEQCGVAPISGRNRGCFTWKSSAS
jgi:hypothetical protein